MKSRYVIGLVLIICGMILFSTGLIVHYYVGNILLPTTDPPMMKSIEGIDLIMMSNRSMFVFFGFIGGLITVSGFFIILSLRKRK